MIVCPECHRADDVAASSHHTGAMGVCARCGRTVAGPELVHVVSPVDGRAVDPSPAAAPRRLRRGGALALLAYAGVLAQVAVSAERDREARTDELAEKVAAAGGVRVKCPECGAFIAVTEKLTHDPPLCDRFERPPAEWPRSFVRAIGEQVAAELRLRDARAR